MKYRNFVRRHFVITFSFIFLLICCVSLKFILFHSEVETASVSTLKVNINQTKYTDISQYSQFGFPNKDFSKSVDIPSKLFPCDDLISSRRHFGQSGSYWILYNYAAATRKFRCDESVTYTTHCDFRFLDNLTPLVQRWKGPISVAVYAPGNDYEEAVHRIQYLRDCTSSLVKKLISFHIYFDNTFLPKTVARKRFVEGKVDCRMRPSFGNSIQSFRKQNGLLYPVNVARNVARDMSHTHHVLASDIELYPSPELIPNFLDMIQRNDSVIRRNSKPKVFVLPIFEVDKNVIYLPQNKEELQTMLKSGRAVPFHKFVCEECHRFPKQDQWIKAKYKKEDQLGTFHVGKRVWAFLNWEPLFIGTKWDPKYDERLTWEGQRDKMTQGYILCVLDYEFHILNNAFLIHRPGIKKLSHDGTTESNGKPDKHFAQPVVQKQVTKNPIAEKQFNFINQVIWPELKLLYGHKVGCQL